MAYVVSYNAFYNAFYNVFCNDAADVAEPVAGDAEALAAWAALVAKAAPVDVVNVPVPVAWVAVVVQVACAARKRSWRLLSTSLKLYLKTSSWHFFFVSRTGSGTPTYFFCGCCFITLSAICDTCDPP